MRASTGASRPRLILLNGGPGAGKSTQARLWVADHSLALALDIDAVRAMLGAWTEEPHAAGLAARRIAVAAAEVHLRAGHDVIVPQFLGRPDFIDELRALADRVGARFVHVMLHVGVDEGAARFAARAGDHGDTARELIGRGSFAPLTQMFASLDEVLRVRPPDVVLEASGRAPEDVQRLLRAALGEPPA